MTRRFLALAACAALACFPSGGQQPTGQVVSIPAPAPFVSAFQSGTADAICALGGDTSISGITCQSGSATSATAFATTVTIPANTLSVNTTPFYYALGDVVPATLTAVTITIRLGSVPVFTAQTVNGLASSNSVLGFSCWLAAPAAASASAPVIAACAGTLNQSQRNMLLTSTSPSVAIATNTAQVLSITVTYASAAAGNALWLQTINSIGH